MTHFIYPEIGYRVNKGDKFKTDPNGLAEVATFDFTVAEESGILVEHTPQPWESITGTEQDPTQGLLNGVPGEYYLQGERVMQRTVLGDDYINSTSCYINQVRSFKEVNWIGFDKAVISSDLANDIYNFFVDNHSMRLHPLRDRIEKEMN